MREIKFRAWDKHAGKMIGWEIIFCFWNFRRLSEKWFIFMQYTGLKDKNGKEIYEGDIVKGFGDPQHKEYRTYNKIQTGVVKYGDTSFKIKNVDTECRGIDLFLGYELQVIGNIYENPELLEHPYPMIWNSETLDYSSY